MILKIIIYLDILFLLLGCNTLKTTVYFGERDTQHDIQIIKQEPHLQKVFANDVDSVVHVVRIFIDRNGVIYPPFINIKKEFIKGNNYSLLPYDGNKYSREYQKDIINEFERQSGANSRLYLELLKDYYFFKNEPLTQKRLKIFREKFNSISIGIISTKLDSINRKYSYNNFTFMMVGFNNTFINIETSNNSSEAKLTFQRTRIQEILNEHNLLEKLRSKESIFYKPQFKKTLYVEIHWDGKFTSAKGIRTALNYKKGLISSYYAGMALRLLLKSLDTTTNVINMLSHSSGANIICQSLFNQQSKIRGYAKSTSELWDYLQSCYSGGAPGYPVPMCASVNTFLLGTSLPGIETFEDYYGRGFPISMLEKDNYHFTIAYNINDPDLGKRYGKGPVGKVLTNLNYNNRIVKGMTGPFGATTLGVMNEEVNKTQEYFRKYYNLDNLDVVDFSYSYANGYIAPNNFHDISSYLNLPRYKQTIRSIYNINN